jgi:hypothetical protein
MISFAAGQDTRKPGRGYPVFRLLLVMLLARIPLAAGSPQEWMTPAEIEKFRDEQDLAKRASMYMSAAKLRIEKAEDRLAGKNAPEGDPLEFNSVADLVLGCRSALHATMISIQDQVTYKKSESTEIVKALKELKGASEDLLPKLEKIQKQAIEKRDEDLYRAVKECAQYADSAARGAKNAIEKMKQAERPKDKP